MSDCVGTENFITGWMNIWLGRNYGSAARYVVPHGVIVMDTIMHYNASENSQMLPNLAYVSDR